MVFAGKHGAAVRRWKRWREVSRPRRHGASASGRSPPTRVRSWRSIIIRKAS